jgi:hypothetical protein
MSSFLSPSGGRSREGDAPLLERRGGGGTRSAPLDVTKSIAKMGKRDVEDAKNVKNDTLSSYRPYSHIPTGRDY